MANLPENIHQRRLLILLYLALGVLGVWLLINYALPWLLPFIAAFGISRLIEPAVRLLTERIRVKRGIAAAFCTVAVFAIVIALFGVLVGRIVFELSALAGDLPSLLGALTESINVLRVKLDIFIMSAPVELQNFIINTLNDLAERSSGLIAAFSGKLLGVLTSAASFSPKVLIFVFTCAISTFFISSGYSQVTGFIIRQIPARRRIAAREFKSGLIGVLGKWVKAEIMLSGVTMLELLAAFLIMRIEFAILLALLIAVIDVLPIIGVGSVLIPWAVVSLITADFTRAAALMVTYAVIVIVRNLLEPKLIGAQLGLPPLATLLAMYVGFCAAGILGIALFPIGLIMLKQLNDREYIKLWK